MSLQLSLFQAADLPHLDDILPEHQARFSDVPRQIFATNTTLPHDKLPVVMRYQGEVIGFFILDTGAVWRTICFCFENRFLRREPLRATNPKRGYGGATP